MPHIEDEASNGEYRTSNQYHSQPSKPLRVICVGAGAAGLLVAYKMKKSFSDYELVCYEKYHELLETSGVPED
jgi:ribulose 1,5-bisphosphate synthetase/thiazole synthase